jgi:hypothetical protein
MSCSPGLGQPTCTTAEHPFYVDGRGWVPAGELRPGDLLVSHDGQRVAVAELYDTGTYERVYNLAIRSFHTYFVCDETWPCSVWAHNACTIEQARAAAARHGGVEIGEGRFLFPTRRAARQAASEIAGDLGPNAHTIRLKDVRGYPWWAKNSRRVIGRQSADGLVGWRDDFLGHIGRRGKWSAPPHINVWGPGGVNIHLYY